MKKRIGLTVAVGLIASVASLQAAACLSTTTVAALISLVSTGCTVDDKLPVASGNPMMTVNLSAGTPSSVILNNSSLAGKTAVTTISPGVTSLNVLASTSGINNPNPLLDLSSRVMQSPVPEPASLVLTGAGLLGLGLFRRRRTSKS